MSRFSCGLLLCAGAVATGAACAGELHTYALDPVHTRVVFAVEHAGFSKAMGAISGSAGTLRFDHEDWRSAQLEVTVPLTRLDLGDAKWNAAALGSGLLDGKRHPQARFVSTRVEPIDADHARVCGDLSLRGITRPVCMDVRFNALKRHPLPPFRRTAGFSATTTLSRSAFGIGAWPTVIGDRVDLMIEAEAVRVRHGTEAPAGNEPMADQAVDPLGQNDGESDPPLPACVDSEEPDAKNPDPKC